MDLGLSGRYTDDRYPDSTYGVQNGKTWSLNADATYNYQDNGAVNAYVTQQYRQRDMTNLQRYTTTASAASATAISIPATASWTNNLIDQDITVDFSQVAGKNDKVAVIASAPLTDNEAWIALTPGQLLMFYEGEPVFLL